MTRSWFITGCSTGFGRLLTLACLEAGETVAATARKEADLDALAAEAAALPGKLHCFPCDVTQPDQVTAAAGAALTYMGGVDVLVNNAGFGYMATQEEGDLAEIEAMYAVNVFGLIRVTQAFLPHFRERRAGMIVNLSSVAGRLAAPRGGFYQSTKWAVEALSQSLFLETSRFGLKVRVIEPGAYATDFGSRSIRIHPALQDGTSPYAPLFEEWLASARKIFPATAQDPQEVIRAIRECVELPVGFLRVPVGRDTETFLEMREEVSDVEYFTRLRSIGWGLGPEEPHPLV